MSAMVRRNESARGSAALREDKTEPLATPQANNLETLSVAGLVKALRHPLIVALLSVAALVQVYRVALSLPGRIHEEDFADFYAAAIVLRDGGNPYRTSLAPASAKLELHSKNIQGDTVIPETPTFLLCLKALGTFPLHEAYWTWIIINLVAFLAAFYLLFADDNLRLPDVCLLIALALLYPPLINLFMTAQSQSLIILALAVAVRCLAARRDGAAGVALAAAALLRGFPAMMAVYLLLLRKWRALLFMILAGALGFAATAMVLGWNVMLDFPGALFRIVANRALFQLGWNVSPRALIWRFCLYLSDWKLGPAVDGLGLILGSAVSLIFFLFALKAARRYASRPDSDFSLFSLWVVTSITVLPITWLNYTTILIVPFAIIISVSLTKHIEAKVQWAAMLSYFLSLFAFGGLVLVRPGRLTFLTILVGESKSAGLLLAYLSAYWFAMNANVNEA